MGDMLACAGGIGLIGSGVYLIGRQELQAYLMSKKTSPPAENLEAAPLSTSPTSGKGWWTFIWLLALIGLVAIMVRASMRRPDDAKYQAPVFEYQQGNKRRRSDSFYNEGEAGAKYWRTRYTLSRRQRRGAP